MIIIIPFGMLSLFRTDKDTPLWYAANIIVVLHADGTGYFLKNRYGESDKYYTAQETRMFIARAMVDAKEN